MCVWGRDGGHMNFHVARRGSPLTSLTFQQWGGGSCLNCYNYIIKKISSFASLARVLFIEILYLVRQADKF